MMLLKKSKKPKKYRLYLLNLCMVLCFLPILAQSQQTRITGTVTDAENGEPLPGATIIVKGSTLGVVTDFDGNYEIEVPNGSNTLIFSFIGYVENEMAINNRTRIDVAMQLNASQLDEVILIGYGAVKKKEITGAVARVKAEDINQFISSDVASRLQGQIAGVNVTSSSGEPGQESNIQIRGITSLSGPNTPLFVVNGIPQIGDPGLSPNEIETIDVLKDAASTAIYGSRGAAGVILITTKQGKEGRVEVNFDYNYGQQFLGQGTPLMNTEEQLFYEVTRFNLGIGDEPGPRNPEWLNNDNTFDGFVLEDIADVTTYNLNVTGGTDNFSYSATGNLFDQDGSIINSNFRRFNGRITTTYTSGRWKINGSIATTNERRQRSSQGLIVTASRYRPYFPSLDPTDESITVTGSGGVRTPAVALAQSLKRSDISNRDRTNINLGITRELLPGLNFITNVGSSISNTTRNVFRPRIILFNIDDDEFDEDPTRSGVTATATRLSKLSWDAGLRFRKRFGNHQITAQGVLTLEEDNNKTFFGSIEGVTNNSITVLNGGTINENVGSGFDFTTKRVGTLGRIQYNFDDKYILSGVIRYDGSSRFGENNRWGTFPSAAAAWNISNEPFWKGIDKTVNNFRIRASYGEVGNDSFRDFEFSPVIEPSADFVFDEDDNVIDFGSAIRSFVNRGVKWETTISQNIGVDLGLFNNRLTLTADYFITDKEDLLFPVTLPGSSGALSDPDVTLNVGNMTNKGIELAANFQTTIGKSRFTIGGTYTAIDNEITKTASEGIIFNGSSNLIAGDGQSVVSVIAEGFEVGSFFLFETNGTIKTQEQLDAYRMFPSRANAELGDLAYVDTNGDGDITSEDRVYKGSGLPDFEFGVNLGWQCGAFDLSMNWFGTVGAEILNGNKAAIYGFERHRDLVNQWSPDNATSNIPTWRGRSTQDENFAGTTDFWLENGDYLRLRQVTLGFNLPPLTTQKIGLSSLRLYLSAQNPLTITGYDGFDPEVGSNNVARRGIDNSRYPVAAIYSLGLNVSF